MDRISQLDLLYNSVIYELPESKKILEEYKRLSDEWKKEFSSKSE